MYIKKIEVTEANLVETIKDESVYVIKKAWFHDGYDMMPIGRADVRDILADDVAIIKIIE